MGGAICNDQPTRPHRHEPPQVRAARCAEAFQLLFDPVNNRIGLKPSAIAGKHAYPAGPQGKCGGKVVRAYRLLQDCGIVIPETLQFHDAEIDPDDGILILDLRTARISQRAIDHPRKRKVDGINMPEN